MATIELVNLDADGSVTVGLDDYDEGAGEVRTNAIIDGDRQQKHGYTVKYDVLKQYNGSWKTDPNSGDGTNSTKDTTLAVIKIQPLIEDGRNKWFKTLKVKLEVTNDRDSSGNIVANPKLYEEPHVHSYAPAQHSPVAAAEAKLPTETVKTGNASLQGGPPNVALSLGGSYQKKVSYDTLKFLKVSSDPCRGGENHNAHAAVEWEVTAIDESLGTGNSITVALLVRRSPNSTFSILADTEGCLGSYQNIFDWGKKKIVCIPGFGTADSTADQYATTAAAAAVTIDRNNMHTLGQSLGNRNALDTLVGGSGIHLTQVVGSALGQAVTGPSLPLAERAPTPPPASARGPASYVAGSSGQQLWDARARRHRNMAVLYEHLAKLHREEAGEAQALADVPFEQYLNGLLE